MAERTFTQTSSQNASTPAFSRAEQRDLLRWLRRAARQSGLSVPALARTAGMGTRHLTNVLAGQGIERLKPDVLRRVAWASGLPAPEALLTAARSNARIARPSSNHARAVDWMHHPLAPVLRPPYERSRRSVVELLARIPDSYFDLSGKRSAVAEVAAIIDMAILVWSARSSAVRADDARILKALLCESPATYVAIARRYGTGANMVHNLEKRFIDFLFASADRWTAPHLSAFLQAARGQDASGR